MAEPSAENNYSAGDQEGTTSNDKYSCYVCMEKFESKSQLSVHEIQFHEYPKNFNCVDCNQLKFENRGEFLIHRSNYHPVEKELATHVCKTCGLKCRWRSELRQHVRTHTGEAPHECQICHKGFTLKSTLHRHKMIVHDGVKPYKCNECGNEFARSSTLKDHTIRKHTDETGTFKCSKSKCGELTFYSKIAYLKHRRSHRVKKGESHACQTCGKKFATPFKLQRHVKLFHTSGDRQHECQICHMRFIRKDKLKEHVKIHIGEKNYKCNECGKEFGRSDHLARHVWTHENHIQDCPDCDESFDSRDAYIEHRKSHLKKSPKKSLLKSSRTEKSQLKSPRKKMVKSPVACPTCDKICSTTFKLKLHLRIHTGERPFKCDECGSKFTRSDHLSRHIKRTHGDDDEPDEPNESESDELTSANTSSSFRKSPTPRSTESDDVPLETADPLVCQTCGRKCRRPWDLKRHMLIHTSAPGDKQHECEFCQKRFRDSYHLDRHRKTHKRKSIPKQGSKESNAAMNVTTAGQNLQLGLIVHPPDTQQIEHIKTIPQIITSVGLVPIEKKS